MRGAALWAVMLWLSQPALAEDAPPDAWAVRKCALYAQATKDALAAVGPEGLRDRFMAENRAFIASGCLSQRRICAQTPQEYAFADLLTIMTMNEGMASTFVPFGCET